MISRLSRLATGVSSKQFFVFYFLIKAELSDQYNFNHTEARYQGKQSDDKADRKLWFVELYIYMYVKHSSFKIKCALNFNCVIILNTQAAVQGPSIYRHYFLSMT